MAATVAAMEQYGFTPEELDAALVSANADLQRSSAKLKPIETAICEKKELQKQVLAYAKTRDVRDGLKKQKSDKARRAYREKHESDFIIADAATRYFKQKGVTKLCLPTRRCKRKSSSLPPRKTPFITSIGQIKRVSRSCIP